MENNYRVINKTYGLDCVQWQGESMPEKDELTSIAIRLASESPGDPFLQREHDLLSIQQRRRVRLLGWHTVDVLNIFGIVSTEPGGQLSTEL